MITEIQDTTEAEKDDFMDELLNNPDTGESKQSQVPDVIINDEKDIWW